MAMLLLCGLAGCASAARDISTVATPAAVHAGLHAANTPDSHRQLQQLLDTPAVQRVGQNVGVGVGVGLFDEATRIALGGPAPTNATIAGAEPPVFPPASSSQPAAADSSSSATQTTTKNAGAPGALAGRLNGLINSSVQEAFLAATDPQFRAGERAMSQAVGEGFVEGMLAVLNKQGPAIGDDLHKQLGPILQDLIRQQIAPAMRDMLQTQLAPAILQIWKKGAIDTLKLSVRPDLEPDVTKNAENASIGASRGTHQAMIESGILTPSGDLNPRIELAIWIAMIAIALLALALFSLLITLNFLALHHWRRRNSMLSGKSEVN